MEQSGPVFEGGRGGRQFQSVPGRELRDGSLEVGEEDAPGDAVNGEVMNEDEEAVGQRGRAGVEESEAEDGAALEVEGGLEGGGGRFDGCGVEGRGKGGEVNEGERQGQRGSGDGGLP
jgi:hypothetical protein